jgi:tetratricopeptide (TPR) repeat protein
MESPQSSTPPEDIDRTQTVPPPRVPADSPPGGTVIAPADERTQEIPPTASPAAQAAVATQPNQQDLDRQLARELSRRGVPPEEIERMVALGRGEPVGPTPKKSAPVLATPPPIPPSEAYEPKPTITLPPFRDASTEQRMEADRLLTSTNIARRRGNFAEAERLCREAIDRVPRDAIALEIYGDILQGVGRVDDALYAYQRATEADSKRRTAEKKYAELMLLQNREIDLLRQEFIPRNPNVAVFFSALFPGAGQLYNGDSLKGLIIAVVMLVCVYVLGWTPYGFYHGQTTLGAPLVLSMITAGAVYIYAVVDANLTARRGKARKSGWEV